MTVAAQVTFANYVQKKTIRSQKTAQLYRNTILLWTKSRGFDSPDDAVQEIRDKNLDPYTVLQDWINLLHAKGRAPKTILNYYTSVKGFLLDSDVDIRTEKLKSKVVLPEAYEVSVDRAPTREELRRILLRSRLHMKAAITVLASSGLRLGELTKLTVSDVVLGEPGQPSLIKPRAANTKTRRKRRTFCSAEATDLLREYLGDRIREPNAKIFPQSCDALYGQLMRTLMVLGLRTKSDGSSMRYELHPHSFRKFFFTNMIGVGIDRGIVEGFMGHVFGLDQSYLVKTDDELRELYLKGMPNLTILSGNGNGAQVRNRLEEMEAGLEERDERIARLEADLRDRNWRLAELETKVEDLIFSDPEKRKTIAQKQRERETRLEAAGRSGGS